MICSAVRKFAVGALAVVVTTSAVPADAATFYDFASSRGSFSVSGVDGVSYDGRGFDAFTPFAGFTSNEVLRFSSFSGVSETVSGISGGGSRIDFFLLSEVCYYDGNHVPGLGDEVGIVDQATGNFTPVLGALTNPGDSASIIVGQNETVSLALQSPEGLFTSVDADNPDGAAHLLGLQVTKAGTITIPNANLWGLSLTFELLVGDIIVFNEDLLTIGNFLQGGLPSDFDYNDVVYVIRHTAVPEPSTYLLLALALATIAYFKRREANQLV